MHDSPGEPAGECPHQLRLPSTNSPCRAQGPFYLPSGQREITAPGPHGPISPPKPHVHPFPPSWQVGILHPGFVATDMTKQYWGERTAVGVPQCWPSQHAALLYKARARPMGPIQVTHSRKGASASAYNLTVHLPPRLTLCGWSPAFGAGMNGVIDTEKSATDLVKVRPVLQARGCHTLQCSRACRVLNQRRRHGPVQARAEPGVPSMRMQPFRHQRTPGPMP